MDILVYYDKTNNEVRKVDTLSRINKTTDEVRPVMESYNSNEKSCWRAELITVDDQMGEVLSFLLGEKQYRGTYDIEDLCERLEQLKDSIDGVSSDIYDIENSVDSVMGIVKEKIKN